METIIELDLLCHVRALAKTEMNEVSFLSTLVDDIDFELHEARTGLQEIKKAHGNDDLEVVRVWKEIPDAAHRYRQCGRQSATYLQLHFRIATQTAFTSTLSLL